jgi:hypothetical protein
MGREARAVIAALGADEAITPSETLARHLSYARAVLADDGDAEKLFLAALSAPLVPVAALSSPPGSSPPERGGGPTAVG